jgi:hypothetical protein
VPKQKMSDEDFDGVIEKIGTLVIDQSEHATKLNQNEFINELSCDCSCVGPRHLGLHPLCCIIDSNQNVILIV